MYSSDNDLSDDAPNEFTFKQAKDASNQFKQLQSNTEKVRRQDRKLRNKKREDLFKEQKQAKVAKLANQELPEDVLNALSDDEDEQTREINPVSDLISAQAAHTQFSSDEDDDADEVDSGINSTITSKISVKEVQGIKSKVFRAALEFKAIKNQGANANIKRHSAKERQLLQEKKRASRNRMR